jgi:hypothetical protein
MTTNSNTVTTLAPRVCQSCKGTGKRSYADKPCLTCNGQVNIEGPDVLSILALIKGRKGIRSKAPDIHGANWTLPNLRAYYVWRMARFHGGMDVTMPITATTLVHGDPFVPELEALAEAVAKRVYGTDMAAAYRWAGALGGDVTVPDGMPASAYPCGPVLLDNNKPEEELPELC